MVLRWSLLLALTVAASGCARTAVVPRRPDPSLVTAGPVVATPVSDAQFPHSATLVLATGAPSNDRTNLLAGVVQRQLTRAEGRFSRGKREPGMASLLGAFFLMRSDELRPEMLGTSVGALRQGAAEAARRGDEGVALALYTLLRGLLPQGAERTDVEQHLVALERWLGDDKGRTGVRALGSIERAATSRALIDGSQRSRETASKACVAWIQRAIELNERDAPITTADQRDEAVEAYRALRSGAGTIAALHLRHGDPRGALSTYESGALARIVPPGLRDRLERAASDDDPQAWLDLYKLFSESGAGEDSDAMIDRELARGAAWGAAVELHRAAPNELRAAAPLALELGNLGMGDVAPALLADALGQNPQPDDVGFGLTLVVRNMADDDRNGDHESAQRTFAAAAPLVARAETGALGGRVRPTPAKLYYIAAAIQARAGDLVAARPLAVASATREPSPDATGLLAAIDRQNGDGAAARRGYDQLVAMAGRTGDAAAEVEALLAEFEIARDQGDPVRAAADLERALTKVLEFVRKDRPDESRLERQLARILALYGERGAARSATQRAYDAARGDPRETTATVLECARRALVSDDLVLARESLDHAVAANLDDEDLVYVALWLHLVELRLGVTSSGAAERALARIDDDAGWPTKLSAWGRGRITSEQLVAGAVSVAQRTEGAFYAAMGQRSPTVAVPPGLAEPAKSTAIELVEVSVARELTARPLGDALRLPTGVKLK